MLLQFISLLIRSAKYAWRNNQAGIVGKIQFIFVEIIKISSSDEVTSHIVASNDYIKRVPSKDDKFVCGHKAFSSTSSLYAQ